MSQDIPTKNDEAMTKGSLLTIDPFTWVQLGSDIDGESSVDNADSSISISKVAKTIAVGSAANDMATAFYQGMYGTIRGAVHPGNK